MPTHPGAPPTRKHLVPFFMAMALHSFVYAQGNLPEIPRFSLSACAAGIQEAPELYWLDFQFQPDGTVIRQFQPLPIAIGGRGGKVEIPVRPPVNLYRRELTEGGETRYNPTLSLPAREEGDSVLLLLFLKPNGDRAIDILDDSPAAHPPGTVRVVNKTPGRCAVSAGGRPAVVAAGATHLLGPPATDGENRFPLEIAAEIPGHPPYSPPVKRLRLRSPAHRLLILFSFFPIYEVKPADPQNPEAPEAGSRLTGYQPMAYRLYDQVEVPEAEGEEVPGN